MVTAVTVVIVVLFLGVTASPAAAHSVSGVGATNFITTLREVEPAVDGVRVEVIELGSRIQVENRADTDLVVLGYQDEPYLRIGPEGVFENRRSPATYLNAERQGGGSVPGTADPKAEPQWAKVSSGQVARWHDHRAHWMGEQDPPAVRRDGSKRHVIIPEWVIGMRLGSRTIEAKGDLVWEPGPSPVPFLGLALLLALLVAGLGWLGSRYAALAVATAVTLAVDAVHIAGIASASAGSLGTKLGAALGGSFSSLIAWGVGVLAVFLLARRRPDGFFAAAFAGLFVAVFGGVADIGTLSRSHAPFAWSIGLGRLLVAASLGLGLGLLAGAIIALVKERPALQEAAATP